MRLYAGPAGAPVHRERDEQPPRLRLGRCPPYTKDAFHRYLIDGDHAAVNPGRVGTKAAARYELVAGARRVGDDPAPADRAPSRLPPPSARTSTRPRRPPRRGRRVLCPVNPFSKDADHRSIQRQAFSGMLWCKQLYYYVVADWLDGDKGSVPPPPQRRTGRNNRWRHFYSDDVLSMPDSWEYPWFASWDMAFHTIVLSMIDPDFAKRQLMILAREWQMNPDGQIPAYEWSFDDVNPPLHAWAAWRIYKIDEKRPASRTGASSRRSSTAACCTPPGGSTARTPRAQLFSGGFLGMDNIGIFNRDWSRPVTSSPSPTARAGWGCSRWSCSRSRSSSPTTTDYYGLGLKFFQNFVYIGDVLNSYADLAGGGVGLWDARTVLLRRAATR